MSLAEERGQRPPAYWAVFSEKRKGGFVVDGGRVNNYISTWDNHEMMEG